MHSDERAVVTDDGYRIKLTVYEGRESLEVELSPVDALQLADDLMGAALPRLARQLQRAGAG